MVKRTVAQLHVYIYVYMCVCVYVHIYIYIYIYSILGPVKPELGVIPSHSYVSILVFLSKRSEEVLLLFSCFWKFQKCVTGLKWIYNPMWPVSLFFLKYIYIYIYTYIYKSAFIVSQ